MSVAEPQAALAGLEVAITGRLACMRRDEAIARVRAAGGSYVATPGESTDLLVFGRGGPPLGEDGRLTSSLRLGLALRAGGSGLRVVPEEELLCELGLESRRRELHRLYTIEQLGRILGVERAELRAWVRAGLIRPARVFKRLCFFEFQQVAGARTLSRLRRAGVTLERIRKSLARLAAWNPDSDGNAGAGALTQLEALERSLVVRLEDGFLAEPSGQLRMPFEGQARAPAAPTQPRAVDRGAGESWFERGIQAEEQGRFEVAAAAYQRAVQEEGPRPEILFNLGNTLYSLGRAGAAARCFERATRVDPDYVEAWNNLGNVLIELDRFGEAVRAYRRGLAIAPQYADAHFNLAEALMHSGDEAGARRHWRAYLDQDPHSAWAEEVRGRLRDLE